MSEEMSDDDILSEFRANLDGFFLTQAAQRNEIIKSYMYMDGRSRELRDGGNRPADAREMVEINISAPIIRAVAGSDAMQDRKISAIPMSVDNYDAEADIMDDCVDYAQHVSLWRQRRAIAMRDSAICGIGATVTYLDMASRECASGAPVVRRIHPLFVFFDNSCAGEDLNENGNFCGYAEPMRRKDLSEYIEYMLDKEEESIAGTGFDANYTHQFMQGINHLSAGTLDMLYHYFWRDFETVYDTKSPFADPESDLSQTVMQDPIAAELLGAFADEAKIDVSAPYWVLDKKQYRELGKTIAAIAKLANTDIALESSKRKVRCYYRAQIARGMVLSKSKSFSQHHYPIQFVTGYYDQKTCCFYGLMRPLSEIQDQINTVMDDLMEYARSVSIGGKSYIKGIADGLAKFMESKTNREDVTVLPKDAEVIPKEQGAALQTLLETARFLIELLPRSVGVGQEFLGVITTGTMTDSLYGKVVKQSLAVLEDFTNSSEGYARRQGRLFVDLSIAMADVEDGRILPILSPGHDKGDYIKVTKQNLARDYAIRVVERPMTDDERNETLKVLLQLAPQFEQTGANVMPFIVKNLPMDQSNLKQLLQAVTPQPTQPDPMAMEAAQANTNLISAQARKLDADALKIQAELPNVSPEMRSNIEKNLAIAAKNLADANQPKGKTA